MKTLYKFFFFLLLLPTVMLAANEKSKVTKHEKQKTFKKSFNVNADAKFNITNRYGNIDVITWNQNKIEVEVTMKVEGSNEDKVNNKLEELDIAWQSAPHKVSLISTINGNSYDTSWWNKKISNNVKIEINYVVKMPITNNVEFYNDYGYINLDRIEGNAYIKCDYGKVTTKELMGKDNTIRLSYTKNSYFEFINNGTIEADYSEFTVAKAKDLNLEADYTTSVIEIAENVVYECDYGSVKIDNINNLDGNGDYLALRLGTVFKTAKIRSDYGSIKIDRLVTKTKTLDINSEFTGITIGFDADCKFNFNIGIDYGSFREPEGLTYITKNESGIGKEYLGFYGDKNTENLVLIESEYGSITLKNN